MKKIVLWIIIGGLLALLAVGCAGETDKSLVATVSALGTQVANQEEWISYQATQIGYHQEVIQGVSTLLADLPGRSDNLSGSVVIHGGSCCMGGTAGDTITVDVAFDAQSSGGEVVDMRVMVARTKIASEEFEKSVWEPFEAAREYTVQLPSNWSSFWVFVQYRDSNGFVSEMVADEIALEGMPSMPTATP